MTLDHIDLNIAAGIMMGVLGVIVALLLGRSRHVRVGYFVETVAGFTAAVILWNHNHIGLTPFDFLVIIYVVITGIEFVCAVNEIGYAGTIKIAADLLLISLALTETAGLAHYARLHSTGVSHIVDGVDRALIWVDGALAAILVVVAATTYTTKAIRYFWHRGGTT